MTNQVGTRLEALAHGGDVPIGQIAYFGDLDPGGSVPRASAGPMSDPPMACTGSRWLPAPSALRPASVWRGTEGTRLVGNVIAARSWPELAAGRAVRRNAVGAEALTGADLDARTAADSRRPRTPGTPTPEHSYAKQ